MNTEDLKVGIKVTYIPRHARGNENLQSREIGHIKSWNDVYVFVDYGTGTAKATSIGDLEVGDKTFYCHNENNSVLDSAFGRCGSRCSDCEQGVIRMW